MEFARNKKASRVRRNPLILNTTQKQPVSLYIPRSIINFILGIAVIGGLAYWFFFSHFFDMKQVIVEGNLSTEGRAVIEKYQGKNIFTIDNYQLARDIQTAYPEAYQVKVYKGIPSTLKAVTTERSVALIWQSAGKSYLVDEMGIVYREAKDLNDSKLKKLPLVVDSKNFPVKLGTRLVSAKFIDFATYINDNFEKKEAIKLSSIEIDETTFDPILVTELGWKVMVDSNRQPGFQLDDLKLILDKHKADIHEYVDLRVSGYGYWK